MVLYDFYYGEYIKRVMLTKDEYNDYVFDDNIKNMDLYDDTLYGVRVTRIQKEGLFWPDKFNIDFIEEVPTHICAKLLQIKELNKEIDNFKEQQRTK